MTTKTLKNRVETLKQPIVEHPWYETEIVRVVVMLGPTSVMMLLADFPDPIRAMGAVGLFVLAHSLYIHYREIQRWRDQG